MHTTYTYMQIKFRRVLTKSFHAFKTSNSITFCMHAVTYSTILACNQSFTHISLLSFKQSFTQIHTHTHDCNFSKTYCNCNWFASSTWTHEPIEWSTGVRRYRSKLLECWQALKLITTLAKLFTFVASNSKSGKFEKILWLFFSHNKK